MRATATAGGLPGWLANTGKGGASLCVEAIFSIGLDTTLVQVTMLQYAVVYRILRPVINLPGFDVVCATQEAN